MKDPAVSGIYQIQSKFKPERIYIGSAIDIYGRWINHKSELLRNNHNNQKLQNHTNKYGINDLDFTILQHCDSTELIKVEQFYLDNYKTYFNILKIAYSLKNFKHTEETKEYLRMINIGHKMTPEQNIKNSIARKGKPVWSRGKKFSESHRNKIAEARRRKVKDILNNKIFNSIGDAADFIGLKYHTLYAQLSGYNINKTTLKFY